MGIAENIFEDLQLLQTQCGIGYREIDAMSDVDQRGILAALDIYKVKLAEPDGDFNRARENLRGVVQIFREKSRDVSRR